MFFLTKQIKVLKKAREEAEAIDVEAKEEPEEKETEQQEGESQVEK